MFAPECNVVFQGAGTASSPQLLEVMSQDDGNNSAGFTQNFVYYEISLANHTYVRLVDNAQNSAGKGAEALYVNAVVVPAGSTLDLNGLNLYTRTSQITGNVIGGTISELPSGGPFQRTRSRRADRVGRGKSTIGPSTAGPETAPQSLSTPGAERRRRCSRF